jgi:probable O-glycosylation ligase (exosortase A-associated)
MTTFALFIYMLSALVAALRWPMIAGMTYIWLAAAHPQTGNGGIFALQWPLIAIIVFMASYFTKPHKDFSLKSPVFVFVLLFYVWTTFTTIVGLIPDVGWGLWWDFTRVILAFFAIGGAVSSRQNVNYITWAMLAGVASMVASGIAQVVLTGGASHVIGVPGSEYAGNNEVARLIGVAGLPYAAFFSYHAQHPMLRRISKWGVLCCAMAVVGTFSRGAFVALGATAVFWAIISRRRTALILQGAAVLGILSVVLATSASSDFVDRMMSIQDYQDDPSFRGREFAWDFALNLTSERPIVGGGFGAFRLDRSEGNTDGSGSWKDAHSIYFESLGEHGYVGLGLYLLMLGGAFFRANTIRRRCRNNPSLYWERDLATATQMSLVFHVVGGLTISTTYAQYLFFILMIVAGLDKITAAAAAKSRETGVNPYLPQPQIGMAGVQRADISGTHLYERDRKDPF